MIDVAAVERLREILSQLSGWSSGQTTLGKVGANNLITEALSLLDKLQTEPRTWAAGESRTVLAEGDFELVLGHDAAGKFFYDFMFTDLCDNELYRRVFAALIEAPLQLPKPEERDPCWDNEYLLAELDKWPEGDPIRLAIQERIDKIEADATDCGRLGEKGEAFEFELTITGVSYSAGYRRVSLGDVNCDLDQVGERVRFRGEVLP